MIDESCNVEVATKESSTENDECQYDECQYVDTASRPAVGSSGGVAYVIDKTLPVARAGLMFPVFTEERATQA